MGDVSRNFNRSEFACKCGCGLDDIDPLVVAALQRIRDRAGVPVIVTSGLRCSAHNLAEGGVPETPGIPMSGSRHLYGQAADFYVHGMSQGKLMNLVASMVKEGRIYVGYAYPISGSERAVHLDVRIPESAAVKKWKE